MIKLAAKECPNKVFFCGLILNHSGFGNWKRYVSRLMNGTLRKGLGQLVILDDMFKMSVLVGMHELL